MTARLLTDEPIEVVADLREHERHTATGSTTSSRSSVARSPSPTSRRTTGGSRWRGAATAWSEPPSGILDIHRGADVVLVGHGTAWTLLRGGAGGRRHPTWTWWARLAMPDVVSMPGPAGPR